MSTRTPLPKPTRILILCAVALTACSVKTSGRVGSEGDGARNSGAATSGSSEPGDQARAGGEARATHNKPSGGGKPTVVRTKVTEGVTIVDNRCVEGTDEQCNGLDDNCDGKIDEGCGYESGAIQVTLAWIGKADMDLYVTDPSGESISFSHRNAASGGIIDQDARGACRPNQQNNNIENAYWSSPTPPKGEYKVVVHYWGECNTAAGPTSATLSIAVGGEIIGAYNYELTPTQKVQLATFVIP